MSPTVGSEKKKPTANGSQTAVGPLGQSKKEGWDPTTVSEALAGQSAGVSPSPVTPKVDGASKVAGPSLYNPSSYAVVGLFCSILPVLFMGWKNSAHYINGAHIRSRLKIYAGAFFALIIAQVGLTVGLFYSVIGSLEEAVSENPLLLLGGPERAVDSLPQFSFALSLVQNSGVISWVLNLVLLIVAVRFLNMNEGPEHKKISAAGNSKKRSAWGPAILGLVFLVVIGQAVEFGLSFLLTNSF